MISESPPAWLQRTLLLLLNARDRETISGDLLEEYREEQLPHSGRYRANFWYLRQLVSLASIHLRGGPMLKQLLILTCLFALLAGAWLGVMENVLKHDGYPGRTGVAACIVIQGLSTLLFLLLNGRPIFRGVIIVGSVAILLLGGSAMFRVLQAQHFEGFVLLISTALLLQGTLTLATLLSALRD